MTLTERSIRRPSLNRITQKSLVEQMGLTSREVARRLHSFDFTAEDQARLAAVAAQAQADLDHIIEAFYARQLEDSEVVAVIGDVDTLNRLKALMRRYIATLFETQYDENYVNHRLRIGKVHKRLGVTPKLFMAAMASLQMLLDRSIDAAAAPGESAATKIALHKILLFDTQLVFEAYVDSFLVEMETAKEEVEKYGSSLGIRVDTLTRQLHEIATKDALTGLFNRRAFQDYLRRECLVAQRYNLPVTLLYMDLNGFKPVNDQHGHEAGDRILRQVGESMLACSRAVDVPARYGGDEFCIIMPRTTIELAHHPVQRLIEDFDKRRSHPVTFSIGLAQTGPDAIDEPSELLRRADQMMYQAKQRAQRDGEHHVAR